MSVFETQTVLPLHVSWDRFIANHPLLLTAAIEGIELFSGYLPFEQSVRYIGHDWSKGAYGSTDWYLECSEIENEQVDVFHLIYLMQEEPQQIDIPHRDLFLTGCDMSELGFNYLFGESVGSSSVVSAARLLSSGLNQKQILDTYRNLVLHELGHQFGLFAKGPYEEHCDMVSCAMHGFDSLHELISQVSAADPRLCPYCHTFLLNRWPAKTPA